MIIAINESTTSRYLIKLTYSKTITSKIYEYELEYTTVTIVDHKTIQWKREPIRNRDGFRSAYSYHHSSSIMRSFKLGDGAAFVN